MGMYYLNNMNTYPKVAVPTFYETIKNKKFYFKEFHPNFKIPNLPENPNNETNNNNKILGYLLSLFVIGFILILPFMMIGNFIYSSFFSDSMSEPQFWKENGGNEIMATFTTIICSSALIYFIKDDRQLKKRKIEIYNRTVLDRNDKIERKSELEEIIISSNLVLKERKKILANKLTKLKSKILQDSKIFHLNEIKKGASEEFFYQLLNKYSNYKVYKSLQYGFYFPDLVIIKDDLICVIEIDEPYAFETKSPIHYDNVDEGRDKYFVNEGFLVIRFCEEQILTAPLKCIDIVNDIYDLVFNFDEYSNLKKIKDIEVLSWSYQTAFDLAYDNSRKNILNRIRQLEKKMF
jgi:very-short-patch-repair endonuclease